MTTPINSINQTPTTHLNNSSGDKSELTPKDRVQVKQIPLDQQVQTNLTNASKPEDTKKTNIRTREISCNEANYNLNTNKYCIAKDRTKVASTALNIMKKLLLVATAILLTTFVAFTLNFISLLAASAILPMTLLFLFALNLATDCTKNHITNVNEHSVLEANVNYFYAKNSKNLDDDEVNKLNSDFFFKNLRRKKIISISKNQNNHNEKVYSIYKNKGTLEESDMKNSPYILDLLDIFSGMFIDNDEKYNMSFNKRLSTLKPEIIKFLKSENKNTQSFIKNMITECSPDIKIIHNDKFIRDSMIYHLENYIS